MRRARAERGQAVVEAVLGILVFVTILLVGIHFAEVGYLSLKAQEAAASAMWNAAGTRAQTPGANPQNRHPANVAALGPAQAAQYADFDGLPSTQGGGATVSQLFTRAQGMQVVCQDQSGTLNFAPSAAVAPLYLPTGGIGCTAQAILNAPGLPRNFMETGQGGFFKRPQYPGLDIPVCAVGRAVNGTCTGSYGLMTNDWGFAGTANGENLDCPTPGNCGNPIYRDAVQSIFSSNGQAGVTFALTHAGAAPVTPAEFAFSFAGIESNYQSASAPGESGGVFNTGGPGLPEGHIPRETSDQINCFLGMSERGRVGCQ